MNGVLRPGSGAVPAPITASGPPTRVLALWSPDWPVTAAARAGHVPPHRPAAVFVANRVLACSAVARAQGVRRGLRRREAQARCPDLAVLVPDADRDARAFEPVVAAVEELAPGVEIVRPGLVVLAARGPAGWFGGELPAAERLVDQVAAATGAESQVGFADGLFGAVLAARRALAVAPGDTPAFLAALGVEELAREPGLSGGVDRAELVGLLQRLGLRSLGAFAALAAEDVASRFGADAVLCHRLARGLDPRPPARRSPPEELMVALELDPPVDRVDAAAFAARGLAEQLHATLAGHGLSCTRLGVFARTTGGEELRRVWRCAGPLTPAGTVDRVRWQLDAWLTGRAKLAERASDRAKLAERASDRAKLAERASDRAKFAERGSGALARLWLVPEETVPAGALQMGLWGEVGEGDERAGRALVRVQALLGPEAVVTAVLGGGRDPGERVRLIPWGDERPRDDSLMEPSAGPSRVDDQECGGEGKVDTAPSLDGVAPAGWPEDVRRAVGLPPPTPPSQQRPRRRRPAVHRSPRPATGPEPPAAWPGRLPAPSPAIVPREPLPADVMDAGGRPVRLAEPDRLSAAPAHIAVDGAPLLAVTGWAGPWPVWQRWWAPGATPSARLQVVLDDGPALLLVVRDDRWTVAGIYD